MEACIEQLGILPWDAGMLTPRDARLLLSGADRRLTILTDAIETAAVQIAGVHLKDGGKSLADRLNAKRAERDRKK
jgi:hypothetical protein